MRRRGGIRGRGPGRPLASRTTQDVLLVLLSFAAGCVDAVGYLGLGGVFVANMTGNAVLLGLALGQAKLQATLHAAIALAGFVAGVAAGRLMVGRSRERADWTTAVTAALVVELVLLAAFALWWGISSVKVEPGVEYALISVSALAMGIQSAAIRSLGVASVSTTYVTGTLTSLTMDLTDRLLPTVSSGGDREEKTEASKPSMRGLGLPADVLLAYGVGAVAGGAAELRSHLIAVSLPAAVVLAVVLVAVIRHWRQR